MSAISDSDLNRDVITDPNLLWSRLRPGWTELLVRTRQSSPFLSESWIGTWLAQRHPGLQPVGLLWRDSQGRYQGCALLSVRRERIGPFRVTRGYLNASGGIGVGSEHNDVLAEAGQRSAIIRDIGAYSRSIGCDQLVILGARAGLYETVKGEWPAASTYGHESESPFVELLRHDPSGEGYLMTLSSNTRAQIRRSIRLYEASSGPASFECADTVDRSLALLDELIELHEIRWKGLGEAGAFSPATTAFHRDLIRHSTLQRDPTKLRVTLHRLRFGRETIGVLYHLIFRGKAYFYQAGLRYDDDPRLKPGLVSHFFAIRSLAAEGATEYDFLGGESEPVRYKRSLSTHTRPLYSMELSGLSVKMRLLQAGRRLKKGLR